MTEVAEDKTNKNNFNLPTQQPKKEEKPTFNNNIKNDSDSYQPTFRANVKPAEKDLNIQNPVQQPK